MHCNIDIYIALLTVIVADVVYTYAIMPALWTT